MLVGERDFPLLLSAGSASVPVCKALSWKRSNSSCPIHTTVGLCAMSSGWWILPSIGIGLDISSVSEKGFTGDRTPLLWKSNGLGDVDSLDFLASLSLQPATLLVPKIYIIQNPFKRLITKVTEQADDDGSAGKLASLRNEGRGDPSIISWKRSR